MSGLNTKDVTTGGGGGGMSKTILPGNVAAKIRKIFLDQPQFLKDDNAYFLKLELETEKPSDDFEGFLLDKDNADGGRYDGQVGYVKANRWSYKDFKSGKIDISRDTEIMKFVKNICEAIGGPAMEWWGASNGKYADIEELVKAFSDDAPFKDIFLNFCVAGREYYKDDGYRKYDLHLPKFTKDGIPFESISTKNSRLLQFTDDLIIKAEPTQVQDFGGDDDFTSSEPAAAPEFEL